MKATAPTIAVAIAIAFASACADIATPYDLEHTRIVAVRATPPAILPGESSRIDLLTTNEVGEVAESRPFELSIEVPPERAGQLSDELAETLNGLVELDADEGWFVRGPSSGILELLRSELGLAPDEAVPLPVSVVTTVDGVELFAQKLVWVGREAVNPIIERIVVDGSADAPHRVSAERGVALEVETRGASVETFAWLTSVGELKSYRERTAILEGEADRSGRVVVVVRDQLGGVAWASADVAVE